MAKNDRNTRITRKDFELVGNVTDVYGKSQKITLKTYMFLVTSFLLVLTKVSMNMVVQNFIP